MSLFELLDARMVELEQIGERAIEGARGDGVPAAYMDRALGPGIILELPDGSRERIERQGGDFVVLERFGPRA